MLLNAAAPSQSLKYQVIILQAVPPVAVCHNHSKFLSVFKVSVLVTSLFFHKKKNSNLCVFVCMCVCVCVRSSATRELTYFYCSQILNRCLPVKGIHKWAYAHRDVSKGWSQFLACRTILHMPCVPVYVVDANEPSELLFTVVVDETRQNELTV